MMLSLALAAAAPMPARTGDVALRSAVERPSTVCKGWGIALAWFANVTGGWPKAERQQLAALFYTARRLGWTIAL